MKICHTCHEEKSLSEFNTNGWNGGKRDGKRKYHAHCKRCMAQKVNEVYIQRLEEAVNGKLECTHCGYDKHHSALDFHHLDPNEKDMMISALQGCSFERIKKEVEKCVVLCANCHRLLHNNIITIPL